MARGILALVKADPAGFRSARRFLKVYLPETAQVIAGYIAACRAEAVEALHDDFGRLLEGLEQGFAQQLERLKENRQADMEIRIKVLETRLQQERTIDHDG
jgi:LPS O-antigen subunit length determinant protein (WzzB/FepE family)